EAGADAAALVTGMNFDAGQVDLAGSVLDVEHARVGTANGDDLPAVHVEGAGVEAPLDLLVPSPDRGDVATHGGLVQLVAELAVGRGGGPQCDGRHAKPRGGRLDLIPRAAVHRGRDDAGERLVLGNDQIIDPADRRPPVRVAQ